MIKISKPNIQPEDINRVIEVLQSGNLVHGLNCDRFEKALSEYLGVPYASLVSSGTAALYLSLLALDIGSGDAVLVPNFTFPATVNTVRLVGAEPILVDVCSDTYTMSAANIEAALESYIGSAQVKAIMPVHEFGYPIDIADLKSRYPQFHIIEDAACALGASTNATKLGAHKVGTQGDLACFSFHPRKMLTTGEGGLVVSSNLDLIQRIKRLKSHGIERHSQGIDFVEAGHNFRMTDFQAALGLGQLPKLDQWITKRRTLVEIYQKELQPLVIQKHLSLPKYHVGHSWQSFMIVLAPSFNRNQVIQELRKHEIESNIGAQCISTITHMQDYAIGTDLPISSHIGQQGLALPMCEQYSHEEVKLVVRSLSKILGSKISNADINQE
ncbi:MAG: glutamine--scyllo-inositol aminotransferase [Myxococcales bacterium]|nr:glutamine--scyllo-inositol aminotransferase [Myxococcales bacterium]